MQPEKLIENFKIPTGKKTLYPVGKGHIHKTFRVDCRNHQSFILQKLNTFVFKDPFELMQNALVISRHMQKKVRQLELNWQTMSFIPTLEGDFLFNDENRDYWRVFNFIPHVPVSTIDGEVIHRAGEAYGTFIKMMDDLNASLYETIPHFHDLGFRMKEFEDALLEGDGGRKRKALPEIELVLDSREDNMYLSNLISNGSLKYRITHNDAKFDNILFDENRRVVSVIDLDTVMNGIVHSDFGDAVRSFANSVVEDDPNEADVHLSLEVFEDFAGGFSKVLKHDLSESEKKTLVYAPSMFAFMQGVRFLNDFLMKDTYYKTGYEEHNLIRAKNQFALYKSIKKSEDVMKEIIESSLY
jgi:hypothetical protein